ncbi:hypothetical protein [Nonomuraea aurantiaca]|uniref:hypothetical protein n=1 Tax=Nonomuraea aurantiaca TaxID=2878562 RepID=UPI001CD94493|nr:hypothetical protein [Nonomuraea aurantiaca]MCA2227576.1 hypothetical protein [Nonomuraea aurantiaca]
MNHDEARIHHLPAIRALGDALTEDAEGISPVSYLDEVSGFPQNMRMGLWSMGVLGFPLTSKHDEIVGYAERRVSSTIEGLRDHRDRLYSAAGNIQTAEKRNEDNVRRI